MAKGTGVNAYDVLAYPTAPDPYLDPARLSALAALLGVASVPFQQARVLEAGCGDGTNLINLAIMAPHSHFTGIDLAASVIARAQETAARAGLNNIVFRHLDLMEAGASLGSFDYILAQGVYAWTPEPVRDALMRLAGQCLSPGGLFFVSYNVLPGCRPRQMLRDILLCEFDLRGDPGRQYGAIAARLRALIAKWETGDSLAVAMADEARRLLGRNPGVLLHDELGELYAPQLFSDVAAHGARHGLAYLCDADISDMREILDSGQHLAGGTIARSEQLAFWQAFDFATLNRFRQSVFCRAGSPAAFAPSPDALAGLHGLARFSVSSEGEDGGHAFCSDNGTIFQTSDTELALALTALAVAAPNFLPLAQWPAPHVREALLDLAISKGLELRTEPFACCHAPGEKPLASPLARVQAARGETRIASLRHVNVEMEDRLALALLQLLDGNRDRQMLASEMHEISGMPLAAMAAALPGALRAMTIAGLLLA